MILQSLTTLLAGATIACASVVAPIVVSHGQQQQPLNPVSSASPSRFQCDLPPVRDPAGDGLRSAAELFSSQEALELQVRRHQAIVRIPSVSYDDMGPLGEDERWKPFFEVHDMLNKTYPVIHRRAKVEKIHTLGLLYTVQGSDPSLQPVLLMAHIDVVPVADASTWTYPPFEAHYDGTWIWGRGASDDKNGVTAVMSAVEALLSQESWTPKRTVLIAFGFDEENSGYAGAGNISKHLLERYGPDSIAIILDEGGLSFQPPMGDILYAVPAVTEKGHLNLWMELQVAGGHASRPFPHTGIGIIAETVTTLEGHPFEPELVDDGPVHRRLQCQARYSPDAQPDLTRAIEQDDRDTAAKLLVGMSREIQYTIQTSQAVNVILGGQKVNAMPERVQLGINYRVSHQNSLAEVQHRVVDSIRSVVEKYNLTVKAFEGDANYERYVADLPPSSLTAEESLAMNDVNYNGILTLTAAMAFDPSPISPSSGPIWDLFAGTIRHTFQTENRTVVPAGDLMTGNTDTRHYRELCRSIYRFAPYRFAAEDSIHTVDEHVRMEGHMEAVQFFYDLVRNFDAAKV